jgi:ribosomal protein S18 acetylase RimI-like enzyme
MSDLSIVPLTPERLAAAAAIYSRTSEGILPTLGERFIREYLRALVSEPLGIVALCAISPDGQLRGFLIVTAPSSRDGFIHKRKWFVLRYFCTHPQLLLKPSIWRHITALLYLRIYTIIRPSIWRYIADPLPLNTLTLPHHQPDAAAHGQTAMARLTSLVVDPGYRRHGIASELVKRCEEHLRAKGYWCWGLVVEPQNTAAIGLYERFGWTKVSPHGAWHGDMIKVIERAELSDAPSGDYGTGYGDDPTWP